MKSPKSIFHPEVHKPDKLYGTATIGARGQVVIPIQARKELGFKSGDRLLVLGKFGKTLAFIKSDQLEELINVVVESVKGTGYEADVRKYIKDVFSPLNKKQ